MATTYALPQTAPSSSNLERRPSRPNSGVLDAPSYSSNAHAAQHNSSLSPLGPSQLHSPPSDFPPYLNSRSSSYLPGLSEKLPFRTGSAGDMRKGRPRGESDLGRPTPARGSSAYGLPPLSSTAEDITSTSDPDPATQVDGHSRQSLVANTSARSHNLPVEILTALLIPLPFLLSSLNNPLNISHTHAHHSKTEMAEELLEGVAESAFPLPESLLSLFETCALTSGTLILVGLLGRLRKSGRSSKRRRSSVGPNKGQTGESFSLGTNVIRRVLLRILCVALPYLATVEIGGVRTGVILLTATAGGLLSPQSRSSHGSILGSIKRAATSHGWTSTVFFLCLSYDLFWHMAGTEYSATVRGYLALAKAILLLNPPVPTFSPAASNLDVPNHANGSAILSSKDAPPPKFKGRSLTKAPLMSTSQDINLTLVAGFILGVLTFFLSMLGTPLRFVTFTNFILYGSSITAAAALYTISRPVSMRSQHKVGLAVGLCICVAFGFNFEYTTRAGTFALAGLAAAGYIAAHLDNRSLRSLFRLRKAHDHDHDHDHDHGHEHGHHHHHHHHHRHHRHGHSHRTGSRFTQFLLNHTEDQPLLHGILMEKESRRIVYFMSINLGFMFVQTFYALVAGSLGLLSDSIHMFFDCMGLLAGLIASVMSRWPPNDRFPYGYGKVETLSGLGNGIFLMIISVEIIWESFERFMEGAELHRLRELMLVSVGGLAVNLIGLLFIGHAHAGHDHGHDHGHSHDNENMMGIYLHILADTMGSVAVIASTIATAYTGWSGWDPIASCVIAILIILASYPLVVGSARRLLLTIPDEVEYTLRNTLQELSGLRGVTGYAVPRFWLDDGDQHSEHHHHHHHHHHDHDHDHDQHHHHDHKHAPSLAPPTPTPHNHSHGHDHHHHHDHDQDHAHGHEHGHDHPHEPRRILGVIHIIAARGTDIEDVRLRTDQFLRERNMHVVIQVDREGAGRCWCGGDGGLHKRTSSVVPGL